MKNNIKAIRELFELQKFSIKMGLENITYICNQLQNPQRSFPTIHVAGTNGKGSTSIMIQKILAAHGLNVGLYTSPHLIDFRERIRVNSQFVDNQFIDDFWQRIRPEVRRIKATFFDTTTAMAFEYFKNKKVDLAVIETGLGGRLDSTNVLNPVAVVITPISVDHRRQLGRSLKSIAREKALIIKNDSTLFLARQKKAIRDVIESYTYMTRGYFTLSNDIRVNRIEETQTDNYFDLLDNIRGIKIEHIRLNLAGHFQIDNACLAYMVARWYLEESKIEFNEKKFRESMSEIKWEGRLQKIAASPDIILDVSHNYNGFKNVLRHVNKGNNLQSGYLILGLLDDKEYKLIVRLVLKYFKKIIVTEPKNNRALPVGVLASEFKKHGVEVECIKSLEQAYSRTRAKLNSNDVLLIMGSHFIIGEILKLSLKFS